MKHYNELVALADKLLGEGFVYGIRQRNSPFLKIGKSTSNPSDRVRALQTGNPTNLILEFCISTLNLDVAESTAHQRLSKYRTNGEWFYVPNWHKWFVYRDVKLVCSRVSANHGDSICEKGERIWLDMKTSSMELQCGRCKSNLLSVNRVYDRFCDICGTCLLSLEDLFEYNEFGACSYDVFFAAFVVVMNQDYEDCQPKVIEDHTEPKDIAPIRRRATKRVTRVTNDRSVPTTQTRPPNRAAIAADRQGH